ncbi:Rieske 2Fe-2S domain-containing protein [Dactylosporangium roseum]|uniref:Rieske 2Fe-2S domain-containing protein n=1 Tax=Dactylosporangium roseum TaxID=47989 RepID=A0ABY5ZFG7_9ACTN|nr:Rieske 2Fe-2S domain-containing protein [Dactylosporangium roseum]UWZ39705.1 Rieske 2Fe-2S domain-containing protein [Dactylosporangium roseum]
MDLSAETVGNWIATGVTIEAVRDEPVYLPMDPPRALARVGETIHCFEDTCTHEDFSLSEGFLAGDVIECAYHFARFCVRTGEVLTQPARRRLLTYAVKLEAGEIYVSSEPRR